MAGHPGFIDRQRRLGELPPLDTTASTGGHNVLPGIFQFKDEVNIPNTELDVGNFNATQLLPEVSSLVEQSFKDPRRKAKRGLREDAESLAARRGLELFDTPVGEPFLRSSADLEGQFGTAEAQSKLGLIESLRNFQQGQAVSRDKSQTGRLGLQETGLFNRSNLFEKGREFDENLRFSSEQFEELLKQQAIANELRLTTIAKDLSVGLSRTGGTSLSVRQGSSGDLLSSGLKLLSTGLSGLKD